MRLLIITLCLLISAVSLSQNSELEEGFEVVYNLKDGSLIRGVQVLESPFGSQVLIYTGDTITIKPNAYKSRSRLIAGVIPVKKGRFHYTEGFHIDALGSVGGGENGGRTLFDISLNKRLSPKVDVGIGIGLLLDQSWLEEIVNNRTQWLDVTHRSAPIYIQGKYFLNQKARRLYVHGRLGYSLGRGSRWEQDQRNNGFLASYGIGLSRASKHGVRSFIQISQNHHYVSGTEINGFWNTDVNRFNYNMWMNRVSISAGLEINLKRKNTRF